MSICETQTRNPKVRAEDTATVLLRHVSGAVSVVDFSYESRKLPDSFPETLVEIETPTGAIVVKPGLTMEITSGGEDARRGYRRAAPVVDVAALARRAGERPHHLPAHARELSRRPPGRDQRRRQSENLRGGRGGL